MTIAGPLRSVLTLARVCLERGDGSGETREVVSPGNCKELTFVWSTHNFLMMPFDDHGSIAV